MGMYSKAVSEMYSKAVSEMYSQFETREAHQMEKYSKAVSEMYSQFGKREAHPMEKHIERLEKYIGQLVNFYGDELEVVGYGHNQLTGEPLLIVDASQTGGWSALDPSDVVFKDCEAYWYVSINDLID